MHKKKESRIYIVSFISFHFIFWLSKSCVKVKWNEFKISSFQKFFSCVSYFNICNIKKYNIFFSMFIFIFFQYETIWSSYWSWYLNFYKFVKRVLTKLVLKNNSFKKYFIFNSVRVFENQFVHFKFKFVYLQTDIRLSNWYSYFQTEINK